MMLRLTLYFMFSAFAAAATADEDRWLTENFGGDAAGFSIRYQHFLQEKPFPVVRDNAQKTIENHRKAAAVYAKLAEVCRTLADSGTLPDAVPALKKDRRNKISGSWNLYADIPVNAADLRSEALFLQYQSLRRTASADVQKIPALQKFADGIEADAAAAGLFQVLKRDACSAMLNRVDTSKTNTETPEQFFTAVKPFAAFLQKYPGEANFQLADNFLRCAGELSKRYQTNPPEQFTAALELLKNTFAAVQKRLPKKAEPDGTVTSASFDRITELAAIGEGTLRRLELAGKPMPVWGAGLDGKVLDAKSLDGKVVLLDFWATWCGPCIAEFPHLKKLYAKYKDKGFEIVSFSVDKDTAALRQFVKKNELPWLVLSKETTAEAGMPFLTAYYGVKALPVVLLRDRDGKCLLLNARGSRLDEKLAALF
ncbi:MAG: TlpA family protein disulfide reductase [Planctomycetaceae bacterium]|jgi:thiol-disulfide isomerase/thioredoxin|nr:TlpA family protein disulfide reductase [Planctomycetaceae bacterium]